MDKEEVMSRLSDIITFYAEAHNNQEETKEEIDKDVEAGEIVEQFFKETYPN